MLKHFSLIYLFSVLATGAADARSAICEVFDVSSIGVRTVTFLTETNVVSFSTSLLHSPTVAEFWEHECTGTMCARDGEGFTEFIEFDWSDLTWIEQTRFYSSGEEQNSSERQIMQCHQKLGGPIILSLGE